MGVLRLRHGREFIDAVCRIRVEVLPQLWFAAAVSVVKPDLGPLRGKGSTPACAGRVNPIVSRQNTLDLLFGLGVTLAAPPAAAVP